MPIYRCSNGKFRIGSGDCIFDTFAAAKRAYIEYLSKLTPEEHKKEEERERRLRSRD